MDEPGGPLTRTASRPPVGRRAIAALPVAIPLLFLGIFFALPVVAILARGLHPGHHWNLDVIGRVLRDPAYRKVAWFTLWEATASTVVTLVVALPMAALFAKFDFPAKRVLWALLIVPFVLPTVVVGTAFLALLGPGGTFGVDLQGTIWLILIAHAFFNVAVVVRTVGGLWGNLDPGLEEAARTLGASRWRAFREVTLPLLRPAIAASASIVFLFCFTSFGVVLLLGGLRTRTLEVEIYQQTTRLLQLDVAAALAILQLVGVTVALVLYGRYQQRRSVTLGLRARGEVARPPRTAGERAFVVATLAFMALLLGSPLVVLVWRSFTTVGASGLSAWRALGTNRTDNALFVSPLDAVVNSLEFALAATLDRGHGRGTGGVGDRPPRWRRRPALVRCRAHAAARHVGRHRRVRIADLARPTPGRPARLVVAGADRPGARRHPLRHPHGRAGAAGDRRRPARGRGRPRCLAASGVARDRPADRVPRLRGRGRASPSPSRSASSAPRRSWCGPTARPCPWPSTSCSAGQGPSNWDRRSR